MKFSKHFIFVAAAILVAFARQSDAGFISAISTIGAAIGNGVSAFIDTIQSTIAEGKQHSAYDQTKTNLEQQASQAGADEVNGIIFNGMVDVINSVRSCTDSAYDCLNEAMNSANISSKIVTQNLNECFKKPNTDLITSGAQAYIALGAATDICEEGARQGLNDAVRIIVESAVVSFDGITLAKDLATQGIDAGQDAHDQSIMAAAKSVQASEVAVYDSIKKAAESAFEAVNKQYSPVEVDSEANLAKEEAAAGSPICQKTIKKIEESAEKASSEVISAPKIKAIEVVRNAFVDASKTIAKAGEFSYNAIDDANKTKDQKLAISVVAKGISDTKKDGGVAIAKAQQALGAVAHIIGPEIQMAIIEAMITTETGRVSILDGLNNALAIASNGIENNASKLGLKAAHEAVAAAGYAGYAKFLTAVNSILETIVAA